MVKTSGKQGNPISKDYGGIVIILPIHGYNDGSSGANNIDQLDLGDIDVRRNYADYGWVGLLATRFGGIKRIGQDLAHKINRDFPSDARICLLCHSNGFAVAHECIKHTSRVKVIISFNGALNVDANFSHTVDKIINFYAKKDMVLKWGAWLRPFHVWGRAGQSGLTTKDQRIENIEMPDVRGHSKVFQIKALRDKYSARVRNIVNAYLS